MTSSLTRLLASSIGFNPLAWMRYASAMPGYLTALQVDRKEARGPHVLVPIIPWLGTAVPWLSLAVGRMLAAGGARVTFAFDDQSFDPKTLRQKAVHAALLPSLDALRADHKVLRTSELSGQSVRQPPKDLIADLACWNAVWELRGENIEHGRSAIEARNVARFTQAFGRVAEAIDQARPDVMFLPGGIFGTSGLWANLARKGGVRVASFDNGGSGTWMVAADGLACHHGDIPRAVEILNREMTEQARTAAIALATAEIDARRQGTDLYSYQLKGSGGGSAAFDGAILIALNSSWDSAALGLHEVFSGNTEWIVETVRYLLDRTDARVVVRQHPAERFAAAGTSDDYGALLKNQFGENPRLHFVAAADPVNTYAILERVKAVIVHSSTIGTDAASMGVPVITSSNAYFSQIGFSEKARSRNQYFDLLDRAARSQLSLAEPAQNVALLCYYTTQVANWVRSGFNPEHFDAWRQVPLAHWFDEPATHRMLQAILQDIPVAVLNHRAMQNEAGPSADRREGI